MAAAAGWALATAAAVTTPKPLPAIVCGDVTTSLPVSGRWRALTSAVSLGSGSVGNGAPLTAAAAGCGDGGAAADGAVACAVPVSRLSRTTRTVALKPMGGTPAAQPHKSNSPARLKPTCHQHA